MVTPKMQKLFKKLPPKKELKSLKSIVDDWLFRFSGAAPQSHRRDHTFEWVLKAKNLKEAIHRSCMSRDERGIKWTHQARVWDNNLKAFAIEIDAAMAGTSIKTFDQLYDLLEQIRPKGIGDVTTYDVAARLAGYLKLEITSLYLHAGVRIGWFRLTGRRSPHTHRVPREQLPKEFLRLPTDEVEDMLCTYRDIWKPEMLK